MEKWKLELGLRTEALGPTQGLRQGGSDRPTTGRQDAGAPSADWRTIELHRRIARYEDAGHGACWLRDPRIGALVEGALLHFDGQRYRLLAWCVMPNHVHALAEMISGFPLSKVLHSWKSFTANEANKILNRQGELWQRDYRDRHIRNAEHFEKAIRYIERNPVEAGLE